MAEPLLRSAVRGFQSEFRLATRFIRGLSRSSSMVPHYASELAHAALGDLQQGAQGLVHGSAIGECP